jgi:hypothetical protein
MSAWDTKDIIVIASAVSGFIGTVVVQLMHPYFAARRERAKIVEGVRRELYQKILTHLDEAINTLSSDEAINDRMIVDVRKAFGALDEARNIFWQHEIDMSEDFRRACGSMLYKDTFEDDFQTDHDNNRGSIQSTVAQLLEIRQKVLATARKELKIKQSLKSTLYSIVNPLRVRGARLRLEIKTELKHWLRKLGFYRIRNRLR